LVVPRDHAPFNGIQKTPQGNPHDVLLFSSV
jgi:hypothetical protein